MSILICLPFIFYCVSGMIYTIMIYSFKYKELKRKSEMNNNNKIIMIHNLLFSSTSGPVLKEIIINH